MNFETVTRISSLGYAWAFTPHRHGSRKFESMIKHPPPSEKGITIFALDVTCTEAWVNPSQAQLLERWS